MIINIPLQIDDATIQGQISKDYENKVKDIIAVRIEEILAEQCRGGYWNESKASKAKKGLAQLVEASIEEFLNSNRDVIVEAASNQLAEKLFKTKKVKEAVANVIEKESEAWRIGDRAEVVVGKSGIVEARYAR